MGEGAHDDGAGVVQSIEVLHLLNLMNIKPKHSIRVVLFMNEENGNRGGKHYAERAAAKNEKHLMALESDREVSLQEVFCKWYRKTIEWNKKMGRSI